VLVVAAVAGAHDLFLKPEQFHTPANADVLVRVLNGTFSKSENSIARDRLADVSVVSPEGRFRVDTSAWSVAGDTSTFHIRTGAAGTYLLGVSTLPRTFALSAKDFTTYLETDGVPDVLAARRRSGESAKPARERYSKHVKALVQVGAALSHGYAMALGYPAEIIPLANPYALRPGGALEIRAVVEGASVPNQFVLYGGRTPSGARIAQRSTRTNAEGTASIPLRSRGTWYVKFIHMTRQPASDSTDYESKWATLTFEVR
jgi:hypothetical protein